MVAVETETDEDKKSSAVEDYLQGPRKKRKNYVITAFGKSFDPDISSGIYAFLRKNFSQLAVNSPKSEKEFSRLFTRQIVLVILEDGFGDMDSLMSSIKTLKERKNTVAIPVLFLTDNSINLIDKYHKYLMPYQEVDNYVVYRTMPMQQIIARIQTVLSQKESRRSRRYKFDIPSRYFDLKKGQYFECMIHDMSAHGAVIRSLKDEIFNEGGQLKIHIPVHNYLPPTAGEFIRLTAKIRRVLMGGNQACISWEYLSHVQYAQLTEFIIEYINHQMLRIQSRTG